MMSSTVWVSRVLSSVILHSVIGTMLYHCVTRLVAVADRWPTTLTPGYNCPVTQSC
jgi:hypothetical protein